jgi:acyl-CoA-binding protein
MEDELKEQTNNRPWLYKKGQSGNPNGRPPGTFSLKEYAKKKLASMTDEEREEFLEGLDKKVIWEMGEGKAKQDIEQEVKGTLTIEISEAIAKKNGIKP